MYAKFPFLRCLALFIAVFCFEATAAQSTSSLATKDIELFDKANQRPMKIKVWYQPDAQSCDAQVCLKSTQQHDKIAVISHGAFGAPQSMNWLGYALASQGWVVVGVAHFGESWVYGQDNIDPSVIARFWQRPQEVRFVIDSLEKKELFNLPLVTDNVVMLGHSSGGFTALAMAGARLEAGKSERYCQSAQSKGDRGCQYDARVKRQPMSAEMELKIGQLQEQMQDPRIVTVIALDPALGHATSERSLAKIAVPTLVVGSVENDFLPFNAHAKFYAEHIANAQLIGLAQGAGHFVYIDSCDLAIKAQGVAICKDGEGVDRKAIQKQILGHIFGFIYRQGISRPL